MGNDINTLVSQFGNPNRPSWKTHQIHPISVDDVIWNLLKQNFVVEIEGHRYDVTFGQNQKGEIGFSSTIYPSPHLVSSEFIRRAFREGTWYELSDKPLTQKGKKEIDLILQTYREKEWK